MTPGDVSDAVVAAVSAVAGELGVDAPEVPVRSVGPGAYGTPAALRLAARAGLPAEEVAGLVARRLSGVAVEGGFITVFVDPGALVESIVAEGERQGPRLVGGWPDRPRTFENPGFVVRYAYARAAAVRRRAGDLGVEAGRPVLAERESELVGLLGGLDGWMERALRERDAGMLERRLVRVAEVYHTVYERSPALPVGDEEPGEVHRGRVTLAEAVRVSVGNGLRMLGETPREHI